MAQIVGTNSIIAPMPQAASAGHCVQHEINRADLAEAWQGTLFWCARAVGKTKPLSHLRRLVTTELSHDIILAVDAAVEPPAVSRRILPALWLH